MAGEKKISNDVFQLIINIVILILGIILIAFPKEAMGGITIAVGIILLVYGGISIAVGVNKRKKGQEVNITLPVVGVVAGVLLLVFNGVFANTVLPFIIGAWAIIAGVMNLVTAGHIRHAAPGSGKTVTITALIALALGVIILVGVFVGANTMGMMIGVCMLLYGIVSLVSWIAASVGKKKTQP